jgi:hypothetical protein
MLIGAFCLGYILGCGRELKLNCEIAALRHDKIWLGDAVREAHKVLEVLPTYEFRLRGLSEHASQINYARTLLETGKVALKETKT